MTHGTMELPGMFMLITQTGVQVVCGSAAVVLVILAVLRHRSRKKKPEDEEF